MGKTNNKRDKLQRYFLYFLLYSIIGWMYEVFLEVVVYRWGYSDRGVLLGPYCPIYGVGALTFLLCFHKLLKKKNPPWLRWAKPLFLFVGCMVIATTIELAASYLLEWTTGSWPWQTYVDYPIHFQGRIALSPSVRFGLGGILFLLVFQPLFEKMVGALSPAFRSKLFWITFLLFLADLAATIFLFLHR